MSSRWRQRVSPQSAVFHLRLSMIRCLSSSSFDIDNDDPGSSWASVAAALGNGRSGW